MKAKIQFILLNKILTNYNIQKNKNYTRYNQTLIPKIPKIVLSKRRLFQKK